MHAVIDPPADAKLHSGSIQHAMLFEVQSGENGLPQQLALIVRSDREVEAYEEVYSFDEVPRRIHKTPPLYIHFPQLQKQVGQSGEAFDTEHAEAMTLIPVISREGEWLALLSICWDTPSDLSKDAAAYMSLIASQLSAQVELLWLQAENERLKHAASEEDAPSPEQESDATSQAQYASTMFDHLDGLVCLLERDGTVIELTPLAVESVGIDVTNGPGKRIWDGIPGLGDEGRHRMKNAVLKAARGATVSYEMQINMEGQSQRVFESIIKPLHDESGNVALLLLQGYDITELKASISDLVEHRNHLEQLLEEHQNDVPELHPTALLTTLESLMENVPFMAWLTDDEGQCTFANFSWQEFTGRTRDDLLGDGWTEWIHRGDLDGYLITFYEAISSQEPYTTELRLQQANRQYRWVQLSGVPVGSGESFEGMLNFCIDVHALREAQQIVALAQDQFAENGTAEFQQSTQEIRGLLQAKNDFIRRVSREARTPISNLQLYHLLLGQRPDKYEQYIEVLRRETDRLAFIAEELVHFAELERSPVALSFETLDLGEISQQFINDRLVIAQENDVSITLDRDEHLPMIRGDLATIERALGILVSNAMNHAFEGEQIVVRTLAEEHDGKLWAGIAVEDREPRFDAEPGVELDALDEIIAQHGGRIEVDESQDGVSVFTVWLPAWVRSEAHS